MLFDTPRIIAIHPCILMRMMIYSCKIRLKVIAVSEKQLYDDRPGKYKSL